MSYKNNSENLTNVYPIQNLEVLNEYYRLFKIDSTISISEKDKQYIVKKLSYQLRHPVTIINDEIDKDLSYLVLLDHSEVINKLEPKFSLVRQRIRFEPTGQRIKLNFSDPSPETQKICVRVLQFVLQGELSKRYNLWQPSSGQPFFEYNPNTKENIDVFDGFSARIVVIRGNNFGIAIDVKKRYVSHTPYPKYLKNRDFTKYCKGNNCLYKYGRTYYELQPIGISRDTVAQAEIQIDGNYISLIDHIRSSTNAYSPELADLPEDASVLIYKNNTGDNRFVPAGLCFQVFDTESPAIARLHDLSILKAHKRFNKITEVQQRFLQQFRFGKKTIKVNPNPLITNEKKFQVPDLEFGGKNILSLRKSNNAEHIRPRELGKKKKEYAFDPNIGFLSNGILIEFSPQFLVMPRSIYDKMGREFIRLLQLIVNEMYSSEDGWNPKIITYEDKIGKSQDYVSIGLKVLDAIDNSIKEEIVPNGKCLIMVPNLNWAKRKHDELAALITSELKDRKIDGAVIHSSTTERVFYSFNENGGYTYKVKSNKQNFYQSYLRNVALVKVLINNEKYPFRLNTPLHADLTIGIDVKHNTACYTFINKYADSIRHEWKHSNEKERLTNEHVRSMLVSVIGELINQSVYGYPIRHIVIHRDGRLFESEEFGIMEALEILKKIGVETMTILEIQKSSPVPLRIFLKTKNDKIYNPSIGTYQILNNKTAYLCSTGNEYNLRGTANPLCVNYHSGYFKFKYALEDVFFLTNLTFTKIDSCSRVPLSIKLTDLKLRSIASQYDSKKLEGLKVVENIIDIKS